jgi:cytochrome oxidase Cu insertion factor (SCO1/SenC/PrrC family)
MKRGAVTQFVGSCLGFILLVTLAGSAQGPSQTPGEAKSNHAPAETNWLTVGQPAPQFAGKALNGKPISLAGFKGKVVLLTFWASW